MNRMKRNISLLGHLGHNCSFLFRSIHGHATLSTGSSFALEYCGNDTHVYKVCQDTNLARY